MSKCVFENLTKEQAEELSTWFCDQGEQDFSNWMEIKDIPSPMTDTDRKGGWREIKPNGDVVVHCYTPE